MGRFPDLIIELARKMALEQIRKIAQGIPTPSMKREKQAKGVTLGEVFEAYLKAWFNAVTDLPDDTVVCK